MVLPGWATSQCLVRVCPVLGVSRGIVVDAVDVLCGSFNGAGAFTPRCCEGYTPPPQANLPLAHNQGLTAIVVQKVGPTLRDITHA